jgi:predicted dehydrogenase
MSYKVGLIGLGIMGQRMAHCMQAYPQFEIVTGWDIDPETCQQVQAELLPEMQIAKGTEAVTNDAAVDLVYIATPPTIHLTYSKMAMQAGKAIFCEKPLAVDVASSRTFVAELAASGLPNAVNFPFAGSPEVATLEKRIREGQHGEARLLEMQFHFSEWPRTWQRGAASWLSGREEGGFLREVFSHFAYLTQRLIGPVEILSAQVDYPDDGITSETYVVAALESNGIPIRVTGGVGGAAPDYNAWTLYGTKKSFRFYDWRLLMEADPQAWQRLHPDVEPQPLLGDQLDGLARLLAGKSHPLPDFAAALAVQELVENLLTC